MTADARSTHTDALAAASDMQAPVTPREPGHVYLGDHGMPPPVWDAPTDTVVAWYNPEKPNSVISAAQYPHVLPKNKVGYLPCVLAPLSEVKAEPSEASAHHAALQRVGYALGLLPGANLHTDCVPAIEKLIESPKARAQELYWQVVKALKDLGEDSATYRSLVEVRDFCLDTMTAARQASPQQGAAQSEDDLPRRLIDAARRDSLTWEDRIAIGNAIARIQAASAPTVGGVPPLVVGRLPTVNQDEYPHLGAWWVQLWDGEHVFARVYGATPEEAHSNAMRLAARQASPQQGAAQSEVSDAMVSAYWKAVEESPLEFDPRATFAHRWNAVMAASAPTVGGAEVATREALSLAANRLLACAVTATASGMHQDSLKWGEWADEAIAALAAAEQAEPQEPSAATPSSPAVEEASSAGAAGWPEAWKREGFNHAFRSAAEALRFLASNTRPSGGEARFNAASLYQIAHELEVSVRELLPAPAPAVPAAGEHPVGVPQCPITGRKFWGNISHPDLGYVATYGGPFDTYTVPVVGDDGELRSERFDQDAGEWTEGGEPIGWFYEDQQASAAGADEGKDAAARLAWLHSPASHRDAEGYEWGIFRVKWDVSGQPQQILQTNSDFSDLDAARAGDETS